VAPPAVETPAIAEPAPSQPAAPSVSTAKRDWRPEPPNDGDAVIVNLQ
jgi:hypothetical protein